MEGGGGAEEEVVKRCLAAGGRPGAVVRRYAVKCVVLANRLLMPMLTVVVPSVEMLVVDDVPV